MKTWFNYLFIMIFASLIPFIIGLLPTIETGGRHYGGGPIRQYFVNKMVLILPSDKSELLVDKFMSGSVVDEYILYLPIALNISFCVFFITYCICNIFMTLNNSYVSNKFHSQRKIAKTT